MPIELTCSCGKRLQVSGEFAGRQGQCPACGGLLQIPERDATVTGVAPSSDEAAQTVFAALGLGSGDTVELHLDEEFGGSKHHAMAMQIKGDELTMSDPDGTKATFKKMK